VATGSGGKMSEPFNLMKLLSSPFTGLYWVKCTMIALGIGMLGFVGYGMYKAYIKASPHTTEQNARVINNCYYQPRSTFGCASMRVYESKCQRLATNQEVIVNGMR
jgi:hypothetical protein